MGWNSKVALVTGAGSGIGEAAATRLVRAGAKVALLSRSRAELERNAQAIRQGGGEALVIAADVSDAEQMRRVYRQLDETWGRLDILFANAGINGVWAPLAELEPDEWDKTIQVNLRGTFLTLKYALPLLSRQGGSVIITSSINGTRVFSTAGATAYSATKAAQVAMAKMAALELAKDRIRVNVICPGYIETNIDESTEKRHTERAAEPVEFPEGAIPLTDGGPGTPDQVADLVYFLASDLSNHITGTTIYIDGGQSLLQG